MPDADWRLRVSKPRPISTSLLILSLIESPTCFDLTVSTCSRTIPQRTHSLESSAILQIAISVLVSDCWKPPVALVLLLPSLGNGRGTWRPWYDCRCWLVIYSLDCVLLASMAAGTVVTSTWSLTWGKQRLCLLIVLQEHHPVYRFEEKPRLRAGLDHSYSPSIALYNESDSVRLVSGPKERPCRENTSWDHTTTSAVLSIVLKRQAW